MKFSIQREAILQPLSQAIGVVERRQTLPVLANFLLVAGDGTLSVTGTDMEVELVAQINADISEVGEITPKIGVDDLIGRYRDLALFGAVVGLDQNAVADLEVNTVRVVVTQPSVWLELHSC